MVDFGCTDDGAVDWRVDDRCQFYVIAGDDVCLIALVLAAVGLYGVLSYIVTQRTSIRIALGAQRGSVLRLILSDGLRPAWIGLLLGLAGSGFAVQLIRTMLYGTRALDWALFAEVGMVLSIVAGIACAIPAWRASRLDPMQTLEKEPYCVDVFFIAAVIVGFQKPGSALIHSSAG
jgi:ABC-type antimicrobial peptide transport system permease subunit